MTRRIEGASWCASTQARCSFSKGALVVLLLRRISMGTAHRFLDKMRRETTDKIVLISNYTETLDIFEKLLRSKRCVSSHSYLVVVAVSW